MKAAATALVLACAGLLTGHSLAGAGLVPTSLTVTVSTTSVSLPVPTPPLPVPVPQVPKPPTGVMVTAPSAPLPSTPATAALPSTPATAPVATASETVQSAALGESKTAPSAGVSGASGGSSASGSWSAADPSRSNQTRVTGFKSSRGWIGKTGPKRRRFTTLTFTLPRAARVVFVVQQVSPICRIAGRFTVKGRAGRNRVRFPSRASRLRLDPGTYRISARTRAGRLVRRVTIVVVGSGVPSPNDIAAARAASVCASARSLVSAASGSTGASNTSGLSDGQALQRSSGSASSPDRGANSDSGAVLAASVEKAARAIRPLLVALLALAIMLLGLASLPRAVVLESRANDLLARHRVEIAGLGAAAFAAVVIAFLIG